MNLFLLSFEERLRLWKEFRNSLATMDEESRLKSVAEFWAKAPLVSIAYDPSDATKWLTPWEMLKHNEWCRSSVAIAMESTLRLGGFPEDRMTLKLIIDRNIQEMLLVLIIDDKWILNYDWGYIRPYKKTHTVLKSWRFSGKSYFII